MSDFNIIVPEYKIERNIRRVANEITKDHKASGNRFPPVMICVLNGAFMFFTDLVKCMGIDVEIDFIRAMSYEGQDNSGGVKILKEIEKDLKGKRVYIVDDLIDTGETMKELLIHTNDYSPAEIKVVTLVHRKNSKHPVDFTCCKIGDEWIYGYGLDDNGLRRNYRNIYAFIR
jgi:hypoxanthine phosphoribosyltransferase